MRMEVGKGIKGYWRRRGYERLNGGGRRRKNRVELARLDGSDPRRRFWKIKLTPRLRLKLKLRFSPKKFLLGLRDAYVKMMMKIANARYINGGIAGYSGYGIEGFGARTLKEYDERMIVEIYKSLVLGQAQLLPRDAAPTIGSAVAFPRYQLPAQPTTINE